MKIRLPREIEDRVVGAIYRRADALDWIHSSPSDRTRQYAAWLEDPEIGSVLLRFFDREGARVWMKDGPMKEYSRATSGIGKYAKHASRGATDPNRIVKASLGEGWRVVPNSVGIKPLRCQAERNTEAITVFWGPAKDFKHLLWAGLLFADEANGKSAHLVVVENSEHTSSRSATEKHEKLAQRCGLALSHVRLR